jgi:hypothetical protein
MTALEFLLYVRTQIADPELFDFLPSPSGNVTSFVPTRVKLAASPNLAWTFDSYRLKLTVAYSDLDAAGLIAKLNRVRTKDDEMATALATKPIAGLPQNTVGSFRDRLLIDVPSGAANATALALSLAAQEIDPATVTDKVGALQQMRRLDDVFIRVKAAQQAATKLGRPIKEVLAFHRTEGNLDVPPSSETLDWLVPSDSVMAATQIRHMVKVGEEKWGWPQLIWLAKNPFQFGHQSMATPDDPDELVKEPAALDWALQICGLDDVMSVYLDGDPAIPMADAFAQWSNDNWLAAGLSSTMAEAKQRWTDLVNNMAIKGVAPRNDVISVTPKDPVALVSGVLVEAMAIMLSGRRNLLGVSLPDMPMKYLVYHAGQRQAPELMTRALLEVHATSASALPPLRDEIRADKTLTGKLHDIMHIRNEKDSAALRLTLDGLNGDTYRWLAANDPTRIQLLTNYLETIDGATWKSWLEHRGNLSRYMVLLDYYRRVFA